MEKQSMSDHELHNGDSSIIAEAVGCTREQVKNVEIGRRGKRKTFLQIQIISALEYRKKQNGDLFRFCNNTKASN